GPQDGENPFELFLVDDFPDADLLGAVGGDHHGHVADGEAHDVVSLPLAEDFFLFDGFDDAGAVHRVHDLVTDFEQSSASFVKFAKLPEIRIPRPAASCQGIWDFTTGRGCKSMPVCLEARVPQGSRPLPFVDTPEMASV